jgi:hypothetical protein
MQSKKHIDETNKEADITKQVEEENHGQRTCTCHGINV